MDGLRMTPTASTNQTRQQLEELDALLQRMLSIPLSPSEAQEAPAPLPASVKVPIPLPPAPPVLIVKETPPPSLPTPGQPAVQAWRVEMPTPQLPPPEPMVAPRLVNPAPIVEPTPPVKKEVLQEPIPVAELIRVTPAKPRRSDEPPLPVWLLPFYLLNLLYDGSTYLLGPLTRWLSYPSTKHVIGWLGVMMILLSFGFALSLVLGFDWGNQILK
jgi:hypothetical protein